jgi:Spy/CpxP family protein refolding chaperone
LKRLFQLVLAVALALPAIAVAAPPGLTPPTSGPGSAQKPAPGGGGGAADAVKKRIRALRASTLIDELQLDEATAGKLFPIFGRYDDETEKLLKTRQDIQRRLANAGDLKDDRAIDKLIDEAQANQRAFWDLETARLADLRKVLTPAQSARLVVVLPALERKIQNQLRKALNQAKRKQQKQQNGGGRNAPRDDEDDDDN